MDFEASGILTELTEASEKVPGRAQTNPGAQQALGGGGRDPAGDGPRLSCVCPAGPASRARWPAAGPGPEAVAHAWDLCRRPPFARVSSELGWLAAGQPNPCCSLSQWSERGLTHACFPHPRGSPWSSIRHCHGDLRILGNESRSHSPPRSLKAPSILLAVQASQGRTHSTRGDGVHLLTEPQWEWEGVRELLGDAAQTKSCCRRNAGRPGGQDSGDEHYADHAFYFLYL